MANPNLCLYSDPDLAIPVGTVKAGPVLCQGYWACTDKSDDYGPGCPAFCFLARFLD